MCTSSFETSRDPIKKENNEVKEETRFENSKILRYCIIKQKAFRKKKEINIWLNNIK